MPPKNIPAMGVVDLSGGGVEGVADDDVLVDVVEDVVVLSVVGKVVVEAEDVAVVLVVVVTGWDVYVMVSR